MCVFVLFFSVCLCVCAFESVFCVYVFVFVGFFPCMIGCGCVFSRVSKFVCLFVRV